MKENEINALLFFRKLKKCFLQPVGKIFFGKVRCKVAKYFSYHNPEKYIGHCLRRISETIVVNASADMLTLKRHEK